MFSLLRTILLIGRLFQKQHLAFRENELVHTATAAEVLAGFVNVKRLIASPREAGKV